MMRILTAGIVSLLFFSCQKNETPPQGEHHEVLTQGVHRFGWDVVKALNHRDSNVLISPLSIHTALSMAALGAEEQTLEEMLQVLHLQGLTTAEITAEYPALSGMLSGSGGGSRLASKNAVFYDDARINVEASFLENLQRGFDPDKHVLDFSRPQAVNSINDWAKEATENRIPKVLDKIEDRDVLFLLNAVYFIGDWVLGFDVDQTQDAAFITGAGAEKIVPLMESDEERPAYFGADFSAVDMELKGGEFAATFILPDSDPYSFLSSRSAAELSAWYTHLTDSLLTSSRTVVKMPRFETKYKQKLNETLQALGMVAAFDKALADLDPMGWSPQGPLYVGKVLHDAFVKVDEKGLEGAAVTVVGIAADSLPPEIRLDRPFFFVLRHKDTKVPLFIGVINNPVE